MPFLKLAGSIGEICEQDADTYGVVHIIHPDEVRKQDLIIYEIKFQISSTKFQKKKKQTSNSKKKTGGFH